MHLLAQAQHATGLITLIIIAINNEHYLKQEAIMLFLKCNSYSNLNSQLSLDSCSYRQNYFVQYVLSIMKHRVKPAFKSVVILPFSQRQQVKYKDFHFNQISFANSCFSPLSAESIKQSTLRKLEPQGNKNKSGSLDYIISKLKAQPRHKQITLRSFLNKKLVKKADLLVTETQKKQISAPKIVEPKRKQKRHLDKVQTKVKTKKPKLSLILSQQIKDLSQIRSEAYCVMDLNQKKILYCRAGSKKLEMASLTKIMCCLTVLLLCDKMKISLSQTVRISQEVDRAEGTVAELCNGDYLSIEQLLYGLMLPSGNDAATSLALYFGKLLSDDNQAIPQRKYLKQTKMMNKVACMLKLVNSHFACQHGLPNPHNYSSATDIALLTAHALSNTTFRKIVSTKVFKIQVFNKNKECRTIVWKNSNKLLESQGYFGVKTGQTLSAGQCFAGYFRGRRQLVVVLLKCPTSQLRFQQTQRLVQAATNYH